jgi:hypothetical protein
VNQRKTSTRYYLFEDMLWEMPGFAHLKRRRALAELQLMAGLVWAREGSEAPCPTIRRKRKNDGSYYTDGRIFLAPKHQSAGGLLHELAHALGHRDKLTHGPAFRERCMRLYKMYGDWSGEVEWGNDPGKRKR